MPPPERRITQVLQAAERGDPRAAEDLLPLVYEQLRHLARDNMAREAAGQTLQPTALVHEAYLRVVGEGQAETGDGGWDNRGHFFAAAARSMRRILVEQSRRKARLKRGGDQHRVEVEEGHLAIESPAENVVIVDEALKRLEANDARKGEIVNLRYFAGLSAEETAQALGLSLRTIEYEWRFIKTWLKKELAGVDDG